jgi:hypothetical protein
MTKPVSIHWSDCRRLAASCVLFLVVGCGGGGVDPILGIPSGTTVTNPAPIAAAPTVTSTTPVDQATLVCPDSNVIAVFSEPMDAATINTSTFLITFLEPPAFVESVSVNGLVEYDAATRTASFIPTENGGILLGNTQYTATLKSGVDGVKSVAGVPLQADFVWTFTTSPRICS